MYRFRLWFYNIKDFVIDHKKGILILIGIPIVWIVLSRFAFFIALIRLRVDDNVMMESYDGVQTLLDGTLFQIIDGDDITKYEYIPQTDTLYEITRAGNLVYYTPDQEADLDVSPYFEFGIVFHLKTKLGFYMVRDGYRSNLEHIGYRLKGFRMEEICVVAINYRTREDGPEPPILTFLREELDYKTYDCVTAITFSDYNEVNLTRPENLLDLETSLEIVDLIESYDYKPYSVGSDGFSIYNTRTNDSVVCMFEDGICEYDIAGYVSLSFDYDVNTETFYSENGEETPINTIVAQDLEDAIPLIELLYDLFGVTE